MENFARVKSLAFLDTAKIKRKRGTIMDFEKLVKTIYEMGEVVISTSSASYVHSNDLKSIGKVDEYDNGIEIMFEDGSTSYILKEAVSDIIYKDSLVQINNSNGIVVRFEQK